MILMKVIKHTKRRIMEEKVTRDMSVKDIAAIFGYSELWIRILANNNKIPGSKKGYYWYFNEKEVHDALYKSNDFKIKAK
jgi:hypothetical protein